MRKAMNMCKVSKLQAKMFHAAKQSLDRRFERLKKLNAFIRERLRIFLKRKYSDQSKGCKRVRDNLAVHLGLNQFG